jgi:PAS domain S-box-containing protein
MLKTQVDKRMSTCIAQACDALQEGLFFVDAQGRVLTANTAFCSMLGYGDEEIKGKNFFDLSKTNLDRLDGPLRANLAIFKLYYFQRSEQYPLPVKLIARDGTQIQVTMRSIITRDKTGEPAVAAGIIYRTEEQFQEDKSYDQIDLQHIWALEQNYRNILKHSGDGIIITDFDSMIVNVNDSLISMLGYDRSQEIVGRYLLELAAFEGGHTCTTGDLLCIDKNYYDAQIEVTNQLFETGHAQSMFYMHKKDGIVMPVEATLSLLTDPKGNRRGTIAICRDITHRVKAEKQLLDAKFFLENVFTTTRDGIYVTDAQGRCIMVNQAFTAITGYTQQELIGSSPASLLPGDADEQMMEAMGNHDDLSLFEARWKRKNGTIFPVEVRLAVMKNSANEDNGIVATVRDCSERKRVLEELRRSHESLEEKVSERTKGIEDVNTALRVLLKGREDDKHTHEEKILANVNELVLPYVDRLKTTRLDERQRASLAIIEANLKDIIAPFAARTASRNLSLTPSEIQIANLIKHGMTAKEIAEIISLSPRTIECHRASIRKKLGITNRKVNLRALLMSSY